MLPIDQTSTTRHEYRLATGRRITQSLFAGVFLVGAGFFLKLAIDPVGRDFALAVCGISLILGLMIIVQGWSARLILDGDQIEVRTAFRAHSATRAEIEGLRKIENQYGRWTRVYMRAGERGHHAGKGWIGGPKVTVVELNRWMTLPKIERFICASGLGLRHRVHERGNRMGCFHASALRTGGCLSESSQSLFSGAHLFEVDPHLHLGPPLDAVMHLRLELGRASI